MFKEGRGKFVGSSFPKKASVAFKIGDLVSYDGNGHVKPANATDIPAEIVGICKENVLATDTTNDAILISVPDDSRQTNTIICDNVVGGLTNAMVGSTYDLSNAESVNVGASVVKVMRVQKVVSSTEGEFLLRV